MNKEAVRSQSELYDFLRSDEFMNPMTEVADYTHSTRFEAGFSVKRNADGSLAPSVVAKSGQSNLGFITQRGGSINLGLINNSGRAIEDIFLVLHSHPLQDCNPTDIYLPSADDLEVTDLVNNVNPGHVEIVLSVDERMAVASLFLYRRVDPTKKNFHHRIVSGHSYDMGSEEYVDTLRDSGFRVMETAYDFERGHFKGGLKKLLPLLFE